MSSASPASATHTMRPLDSRTDTALSGETTPSMCEPGTTCSGPSAPSKHPGGRARRRAAPAPPPAVEQRAHPASATTPRTRELPVAPSRGSPDPDAGARASSAPSTSRRRCIERPPVSTPKGREAGRAAAVRWTGTSPAPRVASCRPIGRAPLRPPGARVRSTLLRSRRREPVRSHRFESRISFLRSPHASTSRTSPLPTWRAPSCKRHWVPAASAGHSESQSNVTSASQASPKLSLSRPSNSMHPIVAPSTPGKK